MSIPTWIILGLIFGFIASKIVNKGREGVLPNIVLGMVGALFGDWIFAAIGHSTVRGANLYSIIISAVGAILILVVYHAFLRPLPLSL